MENNKDIGKAFRDQLNALEKSPSNDLWAKIENDLDSGKKRRRFAWLFVLLISSGLGFGIYHYIAEENNTNNKTIIHNPYGLNGTHPDGTGVAASLKDNNPQSGSMQQATSEKTGSQTAKEKKQFQNTANNTVQYTAATEQRKTNGKFQQSSTSKAGIQPGNASKDILTQGKQTHNNGKISYSREATRISVSSKRLVKSTPEYDEYEVVKTYTYVVKKSKPVIKTKPSAAAKAKIRSAAMPKNKAGNQKQFKRKQASGKNTKRFTKKEEKGKTEANAPEPTDNQIPSDKNKTTGFTEKRDSLPVADSIVVKKIQPKKKEIVVKSIKKDSVPAIKPGTFGIFGYGSPTLSYTVGKNSVLDSRLDNNKKSTDVTFSYGAYLCYTGGGKLSTRIGYARTNLNFETGNVPINAPDYQNISYTGGYSNAVIYNQSNQSESMTLIQDISYTEIPLELKYRLIDKKIGVNAIGGFSYLFLGGNKVSAVTANGYEYEIGRTKNLMDSSFGLNFGLGLDYKIWKKVRFNFEPMVKYNLKSYHSGGKTNMLSLNILTGLQLEL